MNTAREQFVEDYTLVIDNDREGYAEVMELVGALIGQPQQEDLIANALCKQFEDFVIGLADKADQEGAEVGGNLVRQMLLNWGNESWNQIARHYIDTFKESN